MSLKRSLMLLNDGGEDLRARTHTGCLSDTARGRAAPGARVKPTASVRFIVFNLNEQPEQYDTIYTETVYRTDYSGQTAELHRVDRKFDVRA